MLQFLVGIGHEGSLRTRSGQDPVLHVFEQVFFAGETIELCDPHLVLL